MNSLYSNPNDQGRCRRITVSGSCGLDADDDVSEFSKNALIIIMKPLSSKLIDMILSDTRIIHRMKDDYKGEGMKGDT